MNIISIKLTLITYAALIVNIIYVWLYPDKVGIITISNICIFAALELVIAFYEFFASLNRKLAFYIMAPIFIGVFVSVVKPQLSMSVFYAYLAVIAHRFYDAFLLRDNKEYNDNPRMGGLAVFYYLLCLFIVVVFASYIPEFGLTNTFLNDSGYLNIVSNIGSDLVKDPKLTFCMMVLYFSGHLIYEAKSLKEAYKGL